ncbi:mannose-6-phosphate isomerase, class I [Metabacillus litoralis]|uniref:mannose-6-phosphate isomerase, class I n=1 Tax=Metabacillus litoralis TaxID=152268 RepID=UPI001CFE8752|nr:mannose-6-phosphate isomerase, class I [Metabacillus litoralis]
MNNVPLFFEPIFKERIWGGNKLCTNFNYNIPSEKTGEAWVISAHPSGSSKVKNGILKGQTLAEIWEQHGELFNKHHDHDEEFPLLVKVLDANDDLSVQVHPDDLYAKNKENQPFGKTECWYVLSAEEDAEIIYGHHAKTKDELKEKIASAEWNALLRSVRVKAGDFIYVPSGTIHAIGKGIVILEIQQSSDITYRLYDYDRLDEDGLARELHLESAIEVINVPHKLIAYEQEEIKHSGFTSKLLVKEEYFTVLLWSIDGSVKKELNADFLQVSVISGEGEIIIGDDKYPILMGDHFILPFPVKAYELKGTAKLIVSHT